jgi:hypothetical protein
MTTRPAPIPRQRDRARRHPPTAASAHPRRLRPPEHRPSPVRSPRTRRPRRARVPPPGRPRPPVTSRSGTGSRQRRPPAGAACRKRCPRKPDPRPVRPGSAREDGNRRSPPNLRQWTTTRSPRWPSSGPAVLRRPARVAATSSGGPCRNGDPRPTGGPRRTERDRRRERERADRPAVAWRPIRERFPPCRADRQQQKERRQQEKEYQQGHVTGTPRPPMVVVTARRTASGRTRARAVFPPDRAGPRRDEWRRRDRRPRPGRRRRGPRRRPGRYGRAAARRRRDTR